MPRGKHTAATKPMGAIVSLEQAEQLREEYGPEKINIGWGSGERSWNVPQRKILTCYCDEMLGAGGKGGGKSEAARAWLVSGNPEVLENEQPWDKSYTYHPGYHGLILRKNEDDLREFILKASLMYKSFGGEYVAGQFRFPSGAVIDCGHMRDRTSWQKYLGIEYQRIVIEEGALIPDFESYEQLRSCLRTVYPELRCQVLITSNANGPGVAWLTERFMNARKKDGSKYEPGEIIEETYKDPDTGEDFIQTRIWIFSTYRDNPAVIKTNYGRQLVTLSDAKMRRAYLDGDWYALFGSYFGDLFRPEGHHSNEPIHANHVVDGKTVKLQPWWQRSIAVDWGYAHETAVLWGCRDQNKRLYIYREWVGDKITPDRIGWQIAMSSREELERIPSHSMTLWLSHDAFRNDRGDRTIAELFAMGMGKVLGAKAVHVPDLLIKRIEEAYAEDYTNWGQDTERQAAIEAIRKQRNIGLTIRIAPKNDVITWQHCREQMRWEPSGEVNMQYDSQLAFRLLQEKPQAFEEYAKLYRDVKPEVLPKLQIFKDECPRVISAIPKAQHKEGTEKLDDAHFLGKDSVDCFGYLVMGVNEEPAAEPYEAYVTRVLDDIVRTQPGMTTNDLVRTNQILEAEWKEKNKGARPFTPPRGARAIRLMRQGRLKPEGNIYAST